MTTAWRVVLILAGLYGYTCVVALVAYRVGVMVERGRAQLRLCLHCGQTFDLQQRDLTCPHRRHGAEHEAPLLGEAPMGEDLW